MNTQVKKWGNSLAVRLPRNLAEKKKLRDGSFVAVVEERNVIVIKPMRQQSFSLKELVRGIRPSNIHAEIDFGKPRGKEIW